MFYRGAITGSAARAGQIAADASSWSAVAAAVPAIAAGVRPTSPPLAGTTTSSPATVAI